MSSVVRLLAVFLVCVMHWLLLAKAYRIISCEKLVLSADVASVRNCSAQVAQSTALTKVIVDPCGETNLCESSCIPETSELTLNYSLTDFTASSDYTLVNDKCVNTVSLKWKLKRNLSADINKISSGESAESSESTDRSSSSEEEYSYSRDTSSSYENSPTDYSNTVTFYICIYYALASPFCNLALEVRSQIPNDTDDQSIEFHYDCLSLNIGFYSMVMFTYPQLSDGKRGYQSQVYVDGDTQSCKLPSPPIKSDDSEAHNSTGETELSLSAPNKPFNEGLVILLCVISVTVLLIIALIIALIVVTSKRSQNRKRLDSASTSSNSPLITDSRNRPDDDQENS